MKIVLKVMVCITGKNGVKTYLKNPAETTHKSWSQDQGCRNTGTLRLYTQVSKQASILPYQQNTKASKLIDILPKWGNQISRKPRLRNQNFLLKGRSENPVP